MELSFTAPTRPLSINESNRMHWASRKRRLDPWRICVRAAYHNVPAQELDSVKGKPVVIEVTLTFPRAGRRDAHNYTGTVVKTIVDELVRLGLVPDDTPEWVTVLDPRILVDKSENIRIVVSATDTEESKSGNDETEGRPATKAERRD
jgi:hypothetical protein